MARPGTEKQKSQTLKSCGTMPVRVSQLEITDALNDVFRVDAPASPPAQELPPCNGYNDAECSFTVDMTFAPDQGGSFGATLSVTTQSAVGESVYPFQLLGVGAECNLTVTPTTVNFGAVASSGTAVQTVLLRNSGACHCQVDAITAIEAADVGFSFDPAPPSAPLVILGSQGCDGDPEPPVGASSTALLQLRYAPGARAEASTDNASFHVLSASNAAQPDFTVNLEATGGGEPRCLLELDAVLPVEASAGNAFQSIPESQQDYQRYGLIRFGNTVADHVKTVPVTLTNMGNTHCNVTELSWDSAQTPSHHFGLEDAQGVPLSMGGNPGLSVAPGGQLVLNATYAPVDVGEKWIGARELDFARRFVICGGSNPFAPASCEGNGIKLVTNALNIDTSAVGGGPGIITVGFNAASVAPAIDVIPGELDFGMVTLGCGSEEREVKLYNTGAADLLIEAFAISPTVTPDEFRITAAPATPATLTPGSSVRVKVRFFPRQLGVHSGNLIVTTNEGSNNYGQYTVPLKGEGTHESQVVDIFRQLTEPMVDVLWVVDDSGSMEEEQQALADNFPLFFSETSINSVDYHIAVTTTLYSEDVCVPDFSNPTAGCDVEPDAKAGWYTACPGNDRFLTAESSGQEEQFSCNVNVADTSRVHPARTQSGTEAGLAAAKMFLSPPNSTDSAINGGFLRDDAKLYVIIVSVEEDLSEGPTELYVDFFQNLKGFQNRSLVSVSAIAGGLPNGCETAVAGERYADVVDGLDNGLFHDICVGDWGNQLESLAFDSFGLRSQFVLTPGADPTQLSVCVSNEDLNLNAGASCTPVPLQPEGASTGYFYEASSNSIVFNAGSVPARGQYIKVEYEAQCLPLMP
jgi:hypothetical protein